jgi:hypothetical protein
MNRQLLATVVGSLVLFIWGGFSHTVLFVGAGFTALPNEKAIVDTLSDSLHKPGLYFFPGKNFRQASPEEDADFLRRFQNRPCRYHHLSPHRRRAVLFRKTWSSTAGIARYGSSDFNCIVVGRCLSLWMFEHSNWSYRVVDRLASCKPINGKQRHCEAMRRWGVGQRR